MSDELKNILELVDKAVNFKVANDVRTSVEVLTGRGSNASYWHYGGHRNDLN